MPRKHNIDALGASLLVLCSALMGANQTIVKIVNTGLQPVFQAGLRSAFAFLPILIFALIKRKKLSLRDGSLGPGILIGLFFSMEFMLVFQAVEYTTVSRTSIFFYTMPFWTAIGAHFLIPGEKLNWTRFFGLILAIAGVVIAFWHNTHPATAQSLKGDLYSLMAALFWSAIVLVARTTALSKSTPEMQLLYQLFVSSIVLLFLAPFFGELVREISLEIIVLFIVQVLLVVCLGFLTWFWILSVYPASSMASFSFLSPVFGVLVGWVVLDEPMETTILLSLLLVSVGVVLVNRQTANAPT